MKLYVLVAAHRLINAVGGLLMVGLVSLLYDPTNAAVIYVAYSTTLLYLAFEAGLPMIIVQRIASWGGFAEISQDNQNRLGHYFILNSVLSVVATLAIWLIFVFNPNGEVYRSTLIVFFVLIPLLMCVSFVQNAIEGFGFIELAAVQRLTQSLVGYSVLIATVAVGMGVWSIVLYFIAMVLVGLCFMRSMCNRKVSGMIFKGVLNWKLLFSKDVFLEDYAWQIRLFLQSLSNYISNQSWIIFLGYTGNSVLTTKVALMHQIIYSASGFSLLPLTSRFSTLAKLYGSGVKYRQFLSLLRRQSVFLLIMFVGALLVGYFLAVEVFLVLKPKIFSFDYYLYYLFSMSMITVVYYINIVENAKGNDRLIIISLLKIFVPVVMMAIMLLINFIEIAPLMFLVGWSIILAVALTKGYRYGL